MFFKNCNRILLPLVEALGLSALVALMPPAVHGADGTSTRLELNVTERARDPALARAVQDLLDDYVTRLPASRFISTNEVVEPDGQSSPMRLVYWSPHVARVLEACKRSEDCDRLLHRQRIELGNRLGEKFAALAKVPAAEEEASLKEVAVLATALDGLESIARSAGKASAPYNEAYPQVAIRMWRSLGNFALARAMQKDMDFMQAILQAAKPVSTVQAAQFPHLAMNFEWLQDDLGTARDTWALFSMISLTENKTAPALLGLAEAARLEAALGRPEKALGWIAMLDQLAQKPQSQGEAVPDCGSGRTRAHALALIAAGRGEFAEGFRQVKAMSQAGCGVVGMTLELSLLALKWEQGDVAGEGLSILRQQCAQVGRCFDSHKQSVAELQALLNRDRAVLQENARSWLRNLQMAPPAGAQERLKVWVLAQTLAGMPGQQGLAHQLYAALDDAIDLERDLQGATASGLNNLARYDGLRRARLLADFRAFGQVDMEKFEALRGQNLLKKLQRARWAQDFAGQDDPLARSALEATRTSLQPIRAFLPRLAGLKQFGGFIPTLEQTMDEIEKTAQDNYFARLANIKMGFRDARNALQTHESNRRNFGTALKEDEAHLSWLKVQGGYLGILRSGAARSGQFDVPDQVIFAAGGKGLDDTLVLYRELLQVGAGATRGARNHDAGTGLTGEGLALKGVPVWRLPKEGFVASRQAPEGAVRAERLAEVGEYLFQELIAPFMKALVLSKRLSISPDGGLALLPFETLSTEGKPLQAMISVSYVQSLKVFFELQQRMTQRKSQAASRVLSMADPVFPESITKTGEDARGVSTSLAAGPSWTEAVWPALPGTRAEADELAKIYPGMSRLQGREASKRALLAMDQSGELKDFRILHFATHGYVDAERSALVLSYPSRTAEAYLFDEELARLNITSELSILSACNTGLGREVSGDGVIGLPFALFMAGNLNTLMTLWSVDDEGTAQFIPAYLQRVKRGVDMIAALRQTKLAFAAGEYGERNRDPRIWAPFVIYGAAANGR